MSGGKIVKRADLDVQNFSLLAQLEDIGALTLMGLRLKQQIPYDQYEALLYMLGKTQRGLPWVIGDALNYGEKAYGDDTYLQASTITGLHPATLTTYASICHHIPFSRRRHNIPFTTHAEVAYMTPSEQEHWLKLTAKHGWTRSQLREALEPIREPKRKVVAKDGTEVMPPPEEPENLSPAIESEHICQCPACGRYHRSDFDVVIP